MVMQRKRTPQDVEEILRDYVEDILEVEDGYLVLGQTGSYGVGNNDVYLTKLDLLGNELWFKTYSDSLNDYGRVITP